MNIIKILDTYGHDSSIGGRDSTIIYTMRRHNIKKIITADKGFLKVSEIDVINPT